MASTLVAVGIEQSGPILRQLVVITLRRLNILDMEGDLHHQVARELRDWLNAETGDITTELAARFANLVTLMLPSDRDKVSGHLTGKAFDIVAPTQNPDAVERLLKAFDTYMPSLRRRTEKASGICTSE